MIASRDIIGWSRIAADALERSSAWLYQRGSIEDCAELSAARFRRGSALFAAIAAMVRAESVSIASLMLVRALGTCQQARLRGDAWGLGERTSAAPLPAHVGSMHGQGGDSSESFQAEESYFEGTPVPSAPPPPPQQLLLQQ